MTEKNSNVQFNSPVLSDLYARGFIYQYTDLMELDKLFASTENITFYVGFDPTATSFHVGHLLWIKLVTKLQSCGCKPIIICGGATSKIGDPTWKDKERKMLDYATVIQNSKALNNRLYEMIDFENCKNSAVLLNNDDWISKINYMEFLRDFGPLFSVNKMLSMDSVRNRLERQQHLSFLEFNYMLLQSYDFYYLFEKHDCKLQIGGADQWSNMISGVDLIRRKTGKTAVGFSMPLLTTANGTKMGKTEAGAIWLDEKLTSHFDFWQYWRNGDDRDVTKLLKLFTDIPVDEIDRYEALVGTSDINQIKIVLADAITSFVHPKEDLKSINEKSKSLFAAENLTDCAEEFLTAKETRIDQFLKESGLAQSLSAARRLIDGKGVKIDGDIVTSYDTILESDKIVSVGKKKFLKVKTK